MTKETQAKIKKGIQEKMAKKRAKRAAIKRVLFKLPQPGCPGQVTLNWSGDPVLDNKGIAESYSSTARDLVETLKVKTPGESLPRELWRGGEFQAYPIVFLYRHAFELSLKEIVRAGRDLLLAQGEDPLHHRAMKKHELLPLFKLASRVFDIWTSGGVQVWDFGEPQLQTRADCEGIIREFDHFDKGSYAFRYAMATDQVTANLESLFEFDLFEFAATMDRVILGLTNACDGLSETMHDWRKAAHESE